MYTNVIRRLDGSYQIDKNNLPYHVPNEGEWLEQWADVDAYAREHPDEVTEQTPAPPPTLEELKTQKYAEITAARQSEIAAGTTWQGHEIDTDADAQRMAMALMVKMQTMEACGMTCADEQWRLKGGSYITLSQAYALDLALTISAYVSGCYSHESELVASITAAETAEAVAAINWTVS